MLGREPSTAQLEQYLGAYMDGALDDATVSLISSTPVSSLDALRARLERTYTGPQASTSASSSSPMSAHTHSTPRSAANAASAENTAANTAATTAAEARSSTSAAANASSATANATANGAPSGAPNAVAKGAAKGAAGATVASQRSGDQGDMIDRAAAVGVASDEVAAPRDVIGDAIAVRRLLAENVQETASLVKALNGEYVLPEAGGDLLRDGPSVLPTGAHSLPPSSDTFK